MVTDETPDIEARSEPDTASVVFVETHDDDRPISPPAVIGLDKLATVLPIDCETNPATAADLLDRAANLLVRIAADWTPPLAETPEVDAWLADHTRLGRPGGS